MNSTKKNTSPQKKQGNPFAQMLEDKAKIDRAVAQGKLPSSVEGIKFVKLL